MVIKLHDAKLIKAYHHDFPIIIVKKCFDPRENKTQLVEMLEEDFVLIEFFDADIYMR